MYGLLDYLYEQAHNSRRNKYSLYTSSHSQKLGWDTDVCIRVKLKRLHYNSCPTQVLVKREEQESGLHSYWHNLFNHCANRYTWQWVLTTQTIYMLHRAASTLRVLMRGADQRLFNAARLFNLYRLVLIQDSMPKHGPALRQPLRRCLTVLHPAKYSRQIAQDNAKAMLMRPMQDFCLYSNTNCRIEHPNFMKTYNSSC